MSLLDRAIEKAQTALLGQQTQEGYWWATLESNVTMTAEAVLLHKLYGTDVDRPMQKALNYLRDHQCKNGSWELYKGDGGNLSVSIEAYMGLRLLGVAIDHPCLIFCLAAASLKPEFSLNFI
jgi:squalene-hopene/tetraprenyl-beta-curcumene cyclase